MPDPLLIRIGGQPRSLEEEEGLQVALAILQLNQRLRASGSFRGVPGPARRP